MNPDRLAALEDEQRFLLRSLDDLEREYDAGDIDDVDYRELRDGYTVRTADAMRAVEEGRSALPPRPPANWPRRFGVGVAVVLLVGIVWWALSTSSAQRLPGQQATGLDPRDTEQLLLSQARSVQAQQPAAAADLYQRVLDEDPENVEALTYRGWTLAISLIGETDSESITDGMLESVDLLGRAVEIDPTYADPYCFLGVVQGRFLGRAEAAIPYVDECLALDPPADIRGLVEAFRQSLGDGSSNGDGTTSTVPPTVEP